MWFIYQKDAHSLKLFDNFSKCGRRSWMIVQPWFLTSMTSHEDTLLWRVQCIFLRHGFLSIKEIILLPCLFSEFWNRKSSILLCSFLQNKSILLAIKIFCWETNSGWISSTACGTVIIFKSRSLMYLISLLPLFVFEYFDRANAGFCRDAMWFSGNIQYVNCFGGRP